MRLNAYDFLWVTVAVALLMFGFHTGVILDMFFLSWVLNTSGLFCIGRYHILLMRAVNSKDMT